MPFLIERGLQLLKMPPHVQDYSLEGICPQPNFRLMLTGGSAYINMGLMKSDERRECKGPAMILLSSPTRDFIPIFSLEPLARQAVLQLERAAREADAAVYGYALLPSSIHALIGFRGCYDLPGFIYGYKWLASRAIIGLDHGEFHERLYRRGKFKPWMNRFDNLIISSKRQFESKLNYIHNEPVKQGLASNPIEWELSSAGDCIANRAGLIEIARDISIFNLV
jgi:REP element-mobilizing transposase RayT